MLRHMLRHCSVWSLLVAGLLMTDVSTALAGQLLYLASQRDSSIVAYDVNAESGALTQKFRVELAGNPGPMTFSPRGDFLYAEVSGLPEKQTGIVTLSRGRDGSLSIKATSLTAARAPYIQVDSTGKFLLAAHYGEGEVTSYRIVDGVCTGEVLNRLTTEKTAHCIEVDPTGRFVFVPHTSPNKVYQFRLNPESGKLTPNDPPFVDGPDDQHLYHQPRHIAQHPTLKMAYTSNERGGGISAWHLDSERGTLKLVQTLSSLPPTFAGNSAAADIKITPNGRFAFVSNRDVTRREEEAGPQDTLAVFEINPENGQLKAVGHIPTPKLPRSFCIDLSGKFVYSAGQGSATLAAYRIDQNTGMLTPSATYETGDVPIWVMCGDVE